MNGWSCEVVSIKADFLKYHCPPSWCPDCWEQYRKSAPRSRAAIIGFHFASSSLLQSLSKNIKHLIFQISLFFFKIMNIFGCFPTVWWAISVNLLTPHRLPPVCFPKCGRIFESNELPWEYFLWKKKRKILPRFLPLFAMPSLPHFEASPNPRWPVM